MIVQLLAGNPLAFVLCAIVLGLLVGSFLNVDIHRRSSLPLRSIWYCPIPTARTATMRFVRGKIFHW